MRKVPIGTSDFQRIVSNPNLFYVDKTGLIAEFLREPTEITLITRPRRFGKTLNLSMLRYFFEQKNAEENRKLFEGLSIAGDQEAMLQQGSRPVIALTFKDCKAKAWEDMQSMITGLLSEISFSHAADGKNEVQKASLKALMEKRASYEERCNALKMISSLYSDEIKPLILIDEYDVPLQEAWLNGYWDEAISFFRNFFSAAFKDNSHIWRAVLTGCLRVSRESMFTGMNNLKAYSVSSEVYSSHFGFTQEEVEKALEEFELSEYMCDVENWYNGYRFGETTIYSPWSISSFLDEKKLQSYWLNTSGNDLVKSSLKKGNEQVKQDLKTLMDGKSLTVNLREQVVFDEIDLSPDTLWNFLYQTGYLKAVAIHLPPKNPQPAVELKIPNLEVQGIYLNSIQAWFDESQSQVALNHLGGALQKGDVAGFAKIFRRLVQNSFSYFDMGGKNPESFYHAFTLGLMVQFVGLWQ